MDTRIELILGRAGGDERGASCVVRIGGSLSGAEEADLAGRLGELVRARHAVVADVSGLTLVDAAAVRAFTDAFTEAGEWPEVRLALAAPSGTLAAELERSGVAARVPMHPTVELALARLDDRPALTRAFWHFTVTPRAPGAARGHVRRVCRHWDVDDDAREAAEIVVTELVTNAVEHAVSASLVEVERRRDAFRLTVRDYEPAPLPDAVLPAPTSVRGRGLAMVAAVARSWGVDTHDDGKTVWAELATG